MWDIKPIDLTKPGRMITASKSYYHTRYPDHEVYFNANLCTRDGKLWWGDIDLTLDRQTIQQYADDRKVEIFLLREIDGRFHNEAQPRIDHAVASFTPA